VIKVVLETLGISPRSLVPPPIPVTVPVADQDQMLQAAETLQDMQNVQVPPQPEEPIAEQQQPIAEQQQPIAEPIPEQQQPINEVIQVAAAVAADEPPRKKQRQLESLRGAQAVVHNLVTHLAISQPLLLASQVPVAMSGLAGLTQAMSEFPQLQSLMPLVPPEMAPLVQICMAVDGMMSSIATKMVKVQEAMFAAEQEVMAAPE
jgi:hypothetical protein